MCLALLDANAGIQHDPIVTVIGVLLTLGHLSGGIYLVHAIREEIRGARRADAQGGSVGRNDARLHGSS